VSTGQILGIVGAGIGYAIGGPIGAQIGLLAGTLVGNLIDPPKVEGPRLSDLKLQRSTYGWITPYVWGTGRLAGNVIDQTDLEEHKETSGGKGGPEVSNYTYSASFDILLCHGPIRGVRRLWADGRLIWSQDDGKDCPFVLYKGGDDQEPDPTFEAIHGVGNVPAYNGFAHAVFTDQYLTDFGNRIPQYEFEVYTEVGEFPWRVSIFEPIGDSAGRLRSVQYVAGDVQVADYDDVSKPYTDLTVRHFSIHGVEDESKRSVRYISTTFTMPLQNFLGVSDGAVLSTFEHGGAEGIDNGNGSSGDAVAGQSAVYYADYAYFLSGSTINGHANIHSHYAPDRVIAMSGQCLICPYIATYDLGLADGSGGNASMSDFVIATSNTPDRVYLWDGHAEELTEFDAPGLTVSRVWDLSAENAARAIINGFLFTVYETDEGDLILACDMGNTGFKQLGTFYLNDDLTATYIGAVGHGGAGYIGDVSLLENSPLVLVNDGIISLRPPPTGESLATIVADLSNMTSLAGSPSQYDVVELENDEVPWFAIASNMTVRNAIASLRPIYFFSAVECDDQIVFRKLGLGTAIAIPDADLCAREFGDESPDPLLCVRAREETIPRSLSLTYINIEADYQPGVQREERRSALSQQDVSIEVAVGLTDQDAARKVSALLASAVVERETFEWSLTRKWDRLVPCDIVLIQSREIRILTKSLAPGGVLKFTGVLAAADLYTQSAPGATGGGFAEQPPVGLLAPTGLILLDIPILSQSHAPFGFYAAMYPASVAGAWTGATLYKSIDGGSTYSSVASTSSATVIGQTTTSGGSPVVSGALPSHSGSDVIDESEICLIVSSRLGSLQSISEEALLNGGNLCAISRGYVGSPAVIQWELLQFRDAILIGPETYLLRGFLRGRFGTGTTGHGAGDLFCLVPFVNVDAPESELNQPFLYKAVTFGAALSSASAIEFTNTGIATTTYYETVAGNLPVYGQNTTGSPNVLTPGLVPSPHAPGCDPTYFLNECGEWSLAVAGSAGGDLVGSYPNPSIKKVIQFACSDLSTALTPGTRKAVFRMPHAMTLTAVRCSLATADTGSPVSGITVDINEGGSSILSTKLTIDGGELTSTTAATAAVISDASLADDAEITVDIDAVGGNAKGLVVCLIGY